MKTKLKHWRTTWGKNALEAALVLGFDFSAMFKKSPFALSLSKGKDLSR